MKRILLVLLAILVTNTVFCQMPANNLLAWYPFCGDTTDHGGGVNHLIVTGPSSVSPILSNDRFGNVNTAYEFDGVSSLMRGNTFFSAAGDLSYSCWINAYGSQSSSIIYNGNVTVNGFGLVMNNGTIGVAGDSVSIQFGGIGQYLSTPVTLNQWHHLVFTRSGNTYELYIDTTLVGSFTDYFYPLTSGNVFNVGFDYATSTNAFFGQIDDIAVYNKQLSLTEIKALYHFNPDVLPFTLGPDTAICTGSVVLSPSVTTPGAQYLWGTGATTTVVTTSNTVYPPDFPGEDYWLTISKPFGCMQTDTVNVRHITVQVDLGPRDTTYCAGIVMTLNTPVAGETYTWSTGATSDTINVFSAGTYWVAADSAGCFGSDTITITLNPQPQVNLGPDVASCFGDSVTLFSSITYTSPTFLWEAIPILAAPVTTDSITVGVTGKYWVTVTDSGCSGADTVNVLIVQDTFTFAQGDTAICMGETVSPPVTVNPNVSYQWLPTTGMATSDVASPTIVTSVSATYVLTSKYPGCPDRIDSFHLDVQPNPIIGFMGARSVCQYDTIHITAQVSPADYTHYTYGWSPATNLDDPTSLTVVFTAGDSTNLVFTVSTPAGCTAKDSLLVNAHTSEFAAITSPAPLCPRDSVQMIPIVTDPETIATFQWFPGMYISDPTADSPWLHAITSQDYMVVGTSQFGCFDTLYFGVVVRPAAVIHLEDSAVIYPGGSYQISPETNCTYFAWSPVIGLSDTSHSNPIATPAASTKYIVHAMTEWGCTTTDSISIRISSVTQIALPNAFTPGASINNTFKVMKNGLARLNYFTIFDRWGVKVYEGTDIDAGWDGTYKGKPQPFGVYVYQIEAVTTSGRIFQKQGNVTLIR